MLRTIGIFGLTLVSYYDYQNNVTWGYLVGISLIWLDALLRNSNKNSTFVEKDTKNLKPIALFALFILLTSFVGVWHNEMDILWSRIAFIVFPIVLSFAFLKYSTEDMKELSKALALVLITHLLFFYIQVINFALFSVHIDFIKPVTGETQRTFGGSYDAALFSEFFRASGLFAEPGTYANMVFMLFIMREITRSFGQDYTLSNSKEVSIMVATLASLMLSFSVFGYIFIIVYLASVLMRSKARAAVLVGSSLVLLPLLGVAAVYLQQRFSLGDQSGIGFRYEAIMILMGNLDWINLFWGWGFLSNIEILYHDMTFNDLGLAFNILLSSGLFGVALWSLFFTKLHKLNGAFLALFIFLQLTKFTLTYPIVWFALVLICSLSSGRAIRPHRLSIEPISQQR